MLENFITSKTKRSLLKLFLAGPDRAFYVREIARLSGEPLNAVRRELGYLEQAGLVKSHKQGNQKYYSVVKEFPFYTELKKIVYATVGLGDYLRSKLSGEGQVYLAFIYGSVAKNEETAKSDVDLFVVGAVSEDELHRIVAEIEEGIGRTINYTLMSREEFDDRRERGEPFMKRVLAEEKIVLKGKPDVYR